MVRGGGFAGGPVVVNNTLQWKLFRERVYNIFIYTQLFRVKNFSSICLYCIIVSVDIYTVRSACKLRARRTEYKSVFFQNDINCWRKIGAYLA